MKNTEHDELIALLVDFIDKSKRAFDEFACSLHAAGTAYIRKSGGGRHPEVRILPPQPASLVSVAQLPDL
jgi:hypothetical protein